MSRDVSKSMSQRAIVSAICGLDNDDTEKHSTAFNLERM